MATETILHFVGGGSDKIYKVTIANLVGERRFDVNVEYGRRGSTMQHLNKGMSMLEDAAKKIHDKLVKDKLSKGYQLVSSNSFDINLAKTRPLSSKFSATEIEVQLLNAISFDEAEKYIKDPAWGMQEKMDGERRPVALLKTCNSEAVVGFNRKGQEVILPDKISTALLSHFEEPIDKTIFDAEIIGDQLFVFDILQFNGVSVANSSFLDRWKMVDTDLGFPDMSIIPGFNPFINVVQLAITENEKRFMFDRVLAEGGEGVVFKKLDAPYTQGRPNSGGPALKCKFVESASFLVGEANEGKRSVPLYLLEFIADSVFKEHWIHYDVGNVTIPVNHEIPPQGSVIEVQYLYAFEGGSVYQPVFKGVRNDLVDIDCLFSQLKFKKVSDFNLIGRAKPDPLKSSFAW